MKKTAFWTICLALAAGYTQQALGWGRKGHAIVAEIAMGMVDSSVRAQVRHILGDMTLEEAGNWMDDKRSDKHYDYMKSWHYVDFEKGTQYEHNDDHNVVNEMANAINQLEHRENLDNLDIQKNVLVIFHLVGDMHQPLHCGYHDDQGGNKVQVKYLGKETNLHRVWDSEIIESENINKQDCLAQLKNFDKDMIASLQVINTEKWVQEPRSLLSKVYNFKDTNIDRAYVDRNKPLVEQQLLIAGIRLAAILNHLFKG